MFACGKQVKLAASKPHASFDMVGVRHAQAEAGLLYFHQDGLRWTKVGRTDPEKPAFSSKPLCPPAKREAVQIRRPEECSQSRNLTYVGCKPLDSGPSLLVPASATASRRNSGTPECTWKSGSWSLHLSHVTNHNRGLLASSTPASS